MSAMSQPTYLAYSVRDYQKEGGKPDASWTRIGAVFPHKDGKGLDVILDCLPISGRVVLRPNDPKPAQT